MTLRPGQSPDEGDPRFDPDEAVFYAILGEVFVCSHGNGAGNISQSQPEAHLLRELAGNRFRPSAFAPSWRTPATVALAQHMYDSRDFSLMPPLGDALQDAGCEIPDVLAHCRGDGPHVKGCWVTDQVLAEVGR